MGEERWANNTGLSCSPFTIRVCVGGAGAVMSSVRVEVVGLSCCCALVDPGAMEVIIAGRLCMEH